MCGCFSLKCLLSFAADLASVPSVLATCGDFFSLCLFFLCVLEFSFGDWFKIKGKCLTFGLICMQITVKTDSGPSDPFSFFWVGMGG